MNNQEEEKEIQKRVLGMQEDILLEAFFQTFYNDDKERMEKALKQLRELDENEIEKLLNWFENIELIRGTPIEQELYRIKSLYNLKNPPKEGV